MRALRSIVLAALAIVVMGALSVMSRVRGLEDYNHLLDEARHLRELDSNLEREILESKSGLAMEFDEIDATQTLMEDIQTRIETEIDPSDGELVERARRTRALVRQNDVYVDRFKSKISLLRNSVAYVPIYSHRAALSIEDDGAREIRQIVLTLLADILRCSIECSKPTVAGLNRTIADLRIARERLDPAQRESIDLLLRHAQVVAETMPEVENAARAMLDDGARGYDDLYGLANQRLETAIEKANVYRALLVVLSVALIVVVGVMIFRLRRNDRELRQALLSLDGKKHTVEEQRTALAELNSTLEQRVEDRTSELLASRDQFRRLVETTQACPWECVPDGLETQYIGPQVAALLGYPYELLADDNFLVTTIHEADLVRMAAWLNDLATVRKSECEFRMRHFDGRYLWIRSFGNAVFDNRGRTVRRGFFLDVSVRRQLEADLRAAQKLESIGRLASGVAHEINTPIQFVNDSVHFVRDSFDSLRNVLAKFGALLDASPADAPALALAARAAYEDADTDYILDNAPQALESSVEGLQRIATIVKALKEFSHPDRKQKALADLNANIRSTLAIAANEYKHIADVTTSFGEVPAVLCHAGEINQVLLNLVVNAAHAITDKVGKNGERGTIEVRSYRQGDDVIVSVKDSGGGIPVDIQEQIFDPFFTTKEVGRGTGQGLAIARAIVVEKHGGDLTFETVPREGTEFFLRLPITPKAEVVAAA